MSGERGSSSARYLALGDSYTIGEGVQAEESFPYQLCARLQQAGTALQEPVILARTGWTSAELTQAIQTAPPPGKFELATLLVGVNNQYRGLDLGSYRAEFRALLDRAAAFAGGDVQKVVVISIPDWGRTPFGSARDPDRIANQIDAFNQANQSSAKTAGAHYVEITALTRGPNPGPDWTAADGLHPSGRQYAAWVERIFPAALAALAGSPP